MGKTIGILTSHVGGALRPYERAVSRAVSQVAEEQNISVIFYSGGFYKSESDDEKIHNYVSEQVLSDKPDGLIVISSLLGGLIKSSTLYNYLSRFDGIPMVSAGMVLPGIPSVHIQNYQAMAQMVTHMIQEHQSKKFIYIDGPQENAEGRQRFQAFENVLREQGDSEIEYQVFQGDFFIPSGRRIADQIWNKGDMDFDTVISASDEMAFGFIESMEQKGLHCPEDYRITGFDNVDTAEFSTPALTTIDQNVFLLGRTSMEVMLKLLNNEEISPITWLPTQFIQGESCGCSRKLQLNMSRELKEMSPGDQHFLEEHKEWLLNSLEKNDLFSTLDNIVQKTIERDLSPILIISLLESLEENILQICDSAVYWKAVAYVLEASRNRNGEKAQIMERREGEMHHISELLLNTSSLEDLSSIMDQEFPNLEIASCSLCFVSKEKNHPLELKVYYSREEGAVYYPEPLEFKTTDLFSEGSKRYRIVESLDFQEDIIGLLIFEVEKIHYSLFGPLRELISGTLHHIQSFEKIENFNLNLRTQVKRMKSLRTIDKSIADHQSRDELLQVLLNQVQEQQKVDAVSLLLFDPDQQILEFSTCLGIQSGLFKHSRLKLGEGNAGKAGKLQKQILIEDIRHSRDFIDFSLFQRENFIGYCAAPLVAHGKLKGVLELFHRTPLKRDKDWFRFLETLTGQAAIALENTFLISDLKKVNDELLQAYRITIEGWSRALDLRDHETEGHCMRVAQMSVEMGRNLKMKPLELEALYRGALLHDIGKMGIPDSILQKPGPLSEEERRVMNYHPQYAFELLSPIDFLHSALTVPWCHHEKWDGTGYPRGLAGKDIPLNARIFALIDVWDALTSDRPYRGAWSKEKARDYIHSLAGVHFDPELIEPFFKMIEKSNEWPVDIPAPVSRYSFKE